MSIMVTKWGNEVNLELLIPDFMKLYRQCLHFLEDNDPNKSNEPTTSQSLPPQESQRSLPPLPPNPYSNPNLFPSQVSTGRNLDPRSDDYLQTRVEEFRVDLGQWKLNDWSDVVGISNLKTKLQKAIEVRIKACNQTASMPTPPGVLQHGPSGTGKILTPMSFAKKYGLQFWQLNSTALGSLQGESVK